MEDLARPSAYHLQMLAGTGGQVDTL